MSLKLNRIENIIVYLFDWRRLNIAGIDGDTTSAIVDAALSMLRVKDVQVDNNVQ